jgi:NDP-sugar pyrophosphorylase family protein
MVGVTKPGKAATAAEILGAGAKTVPTAANPAKMRRLLDNPKITSVILRGTGQFNRVSGSRGDYWLAKDRAFVDESAVVGQGSIIYPRATVGSCVIIGINVSVGASSTINIAAIINNSAIILPGARIGAGAIIRENTVVDVGCSVASDATVGPAATAAAAKHLRTETRKLA